MASADAPNICRPQLPATVLVLPPHAEVLPRPTAAVVQLSERQGLPWADLWRQMADERRIDVGEDGLQRVDSRLCDRVAPGRTWPGAMALEHDLRGMPLGVQVWRPSLQGSVPESLHVCEPHACLDGWQVPPQVERLLGLEPFAAPFTERVQEPPQESAASTPAASVHARRLRLCLSA